MYVDLVWNVNQPGRWRRRALVEVCREADTDWKRYLLNRPPEPWDPAEVPRSSACSGPIPPGIPGQWMAHQIDTVHWFPGFSYPRSAVTNGGIYCWKDGRTNADTMTTVLDYGPEDRERRRVPGGLQFAVQQQRRRHEGGLLLERRDDGPRHRQGDA